jgi:NADPH2:quinone reductase
LFRTQDQIIRETLMTNSLPESMTAIAIREPGGPDVLVPEIRPLPQPRAGEILVRVAAAGINRPDVLQRQGAYPPPPGAPDIPGLEIAGKVVAIGPDASRFKLGDEICALVPGGGYAEYCVVHETNALPVPDGLSLTEAAGIPETFFTVWTNVFERGALKAGETLLVHGGTSGIGTTAMTLHDAQPERGQQFGRAVAVMPFNGEPVIAVAADNEVFVYFRSALYGETRTGR